MDGKKHHELLSAEVSLPSFAELQQKTRQTLYGINTENDNSNDFTDKSPKGSVDHPIQSLVDLINHHSAVSTLSSCSGRISLFDPNGEDSTDTTATAAFTDGSGKGRGKWRIVSHDLIDNPQEVVDAVLLPSPDSKKNGDSNGVLLVPSDAAEPWTLKLEPMLLHVAARSLAVGQALLQIALACGFRESGLVVTSKRVTVAIRSHSLALAVPLFLPPRATVPSAEYVIALVEECNRRLQANWDHMNRLHRALEKDWFQVKVHATIRVVSTLPPLRLWSVATVAASHDTVDGNTSIIYAFGGYGQGPTIESTSSQRSQDIYQLSVDNHARTSPAWTKVVIESCVASDACWKGLSSLSSMAVQPLTELPTRRQGMAAARLRDWIVLWGGRESPTKPLDELLLYHPSTHKLCRVTTTQEIIPAARWGHALVPISDDRLILVGGSTSGRTVGGDEGNNGPQQPDILEHIYILHYTQEYGFLWEQVEGVKLTGGRLHPAATLLSPKSNTVAIVGGLMPLVSQANPLTLFDKTPREDDDTGLIMIRFGDTIATKQQHGGYSSSTSGTTFLPLLKTQAQRMDQHDHKTRAGANSSFLQSQNDSVVGAALSTFLSGRVAILSGGAAGANTTSHGDVGISVFLVDCDERKWMEVPVVLEGTHLDPGCLVHHSNVVLSDHRMASVGGGVTSFAFGDSFAESFLLDITLKGYGSDVHTSQDDESPSFDKLQDVTAPNAVHAVTTPIQTMASPPVSSSTTSTTTTTTTTRTPVIYVAPKDAKTVKTLLENQGLLDKGHRMIPIINNTNDQTTRIAIPLTAEAAAASQIVEDDSTTSITTMILGRGYETDMPLSTARFAAHSK